MKYKCKKSFCVDNYDDDGFMIENAAMVIEEGKVYETDESGHMMIGGSDHVHLDAVDDGSWLEITKGTLEECFDLLEARGMNVLEKILEDVERLEDPYYKDYVDRKHVAEIIRSHMDEVPNCGKCSRRKGYQKGFEDGKKAYLHGLLETKGSEKNESQKKP